MPSELETDNTEHEEITVMNHTAPVKRSSLQHPTSLLSNEMVSSPRENRSMRLHDKSQFLKSGKPIEQTNSDQHAATAGKINVRNSVPPMPLGNRHKPWPSRKVTGVEEVVKYMSSVPCYLQCLEKGDSVQEKALNFGVLDWGRLEKWTYLQRQEANRRCGDSPSSSNASSSSFSTFKSSSQSGRSIDSPLAQRKQSPTLDAHRNSSAEGRQTKMMEEQTSGRVMGFTDSRTSHVNTSIGHNHEKGKGKGSDMKGICRDKSHPPDICSSPSTSKYNDTSAFAHNKVKTQIGRSREAEKFQSCEQQCFPGSVHFAENRLQDQCSAIEGMWDNLQESVHKRRISFDFAMVNNGKPVEANRNSFSGNFPPDDIQFTNPSPHIPHSCPLSSTSQSDEPAVASTPLSKNEVPTSNTKGKHAKQDSSEQFVLKMADRSGQDEVKVVAAPRRELSSHRLLRAGLNRIRSSSLREGSSGQPMTQTISSDNSHEDNAAANSRDRRSPLRRILDPLLKSKNRIHFSGPIASSSSHQTQELSNSEKLPLRDELKLAKGPCKSSDTSINPSSSQVTESGCSVQDERHVTSTRQALLKLAWKNGLPLFMLSSNDDNFLAATMGKRSISKKNDFECIYTIFTAHEVKKKGGVWMSHGNKSKQHGLAYNVVGQLRVSSSKSTSYVSKSYSFVREFVLFGAELIPTTHEPDSSLFNSELAAVVVKVPSESPESSYGDVLQSSSCRDSSWMNSAEDKYSCCQVESLHSERNPENSSLSSIVAILPSGVHGLSSAGEPSPLIERWKSGGSCDCGGWDEGCMLTVLTDKVKESRSTSSARACTTDETHRIELFTQGEAGENKHAFRMVAFKEGVYTVDHAASIAVLQAFAICIATLHSWKPTNLSGLRYSAEAQSLQEQASADHTRMASTKTQGGAPTSYVPDHPPLSPVGRA